ncbi:MAG: cytochrome c3 family protein [Planctomycetes bacterium]|nr:cytochrome c3 family protein [Planctomycetota bacterium]
MSIALDSAAQDRVSCAKCHEAETAAETGGVHGLAGLGCAECHGGDPKGESKEAGHGGAFRGRVPRQETAEFCARCHSDVRMMNPYGIATDQYAQYQSSKHGEAMAKGVTDVATCVDCHGTHGIRKGRDPASPVYPKNVPATCGKCHSDADLMRRHGLKATAEAQYRRSVHGEFLLSKGDLSAPSCAVCHGNHGAAPPGFRDIIHVCGKCHIKQQEMFAQSPHAALTDSGDFLGCVSCHGNHRVLRTVDEIFNRCDTCHEAGERALHTRDAIAAVLAKAAVRYGGVASRVAAMTRAGFHTEDEGLQLEEARTALLQIPPVQHTLDLAKIERLLAAEDARLGEIEERLETKERAERIKKIALVPIWIFLLGMAFVFARKRKSLESGRG